MMEIAQSTIDLLAQIQGWQDVLQTAGNLPLDGLVLAQQFDQDILGDMGKAWNTFIESGQVWALLIGAVLGYLVRSVTAY